jgi:hypothetical protein
MQRPDSSRAVSGDLGYTSGYSSRHTHRGQESGGGSFSRAMSSPSSHTGSRGVGLGCTMNLDRATFRVRAEPLLGNAGKCGVWSVCRVAHVCHCAGWLADRLADSEQVARSGSLRARLPSTGTLGTRWRSPRSECRTSAASTAAPDCCRSCASDRAHWEWLSGGSLRQFAVAAAALGLMWANMLRRFQVGKADTSHEGPWSWIRESRVASAQDSWPACHFTNASASAVM